MKSKKCSICGEAIAIEYFPDSMGFCNERQNGGYWAEGYNAQPINDGSCCKECDEKYVYPARIKQHLDEVENTGWKRITLEIPNQN